MTITNLEVATAELKNGIYEVNYGFDENGEPREAVARISKTMMDWFIENVMFQHLGAYEQYTSEQLTTKYLAWYYFLTEQVELNIDGKTYELIYTAKKGDCLCWLLVDENLNIKEPHTLPIEQQHKLKYEAHFKEATKNEKLNF